MVHKNNNHMVIMFKPIHTRSWLLPLLITAYLKWCLLLTSQLLFELYHLVGVDFIYHAYSAFKVLSYFFNSWPWKNVSLIIFGVCLFLFLQLRKQRKLRLDRSMEVS